MTATSSSADSLQTIVASYESYAAAETAVLSLARANVPMKTISIIGRRFDTQEHIQAFYRPADDLLAGAGQGAWFGGVFGIIAGAFGYSVMPSIGSMLILGPMSQLVACAITDSGIGAVVSAFIAAGVPQEDAMNYENRLHSGEFLVAVHSSELEARRAQIILADTSHACLHTHCFHERTTELNDGQTRL
jgi:hypothetical protein